MLRTRATDDAACAGIALRRRGRGAEELVELRLQRRRGRDPVVGAEAQAPQPSRVCISSSTSFSPGKSPNSDLSSSIRPAPNSAALTRSVSGPADLARLGARGRDLVRSGLERLGLVDDEAELARLTLVDPPADHDDPVDLDHLGDLRGGVADEQLEPALEVVESGEHHVAAAPGAHLLRLGDDPADRHPGAVGQSTARRRAGARPGPAAPRAPRPADARRRTCRGSPSRAAAARAGRTRPPAPAGARAPRRHRRRGSASASPPPRSKIEPWPRRESS